VVTFTKEQMMQELRLILRSEAERIAQIRDDKTAWIFLDLHNNGAALDNVELGDIDLGKFHAGSVLDFLYEYAYRPQAHHLSYDVHFYVTDGLALMEGVVVEGIQVLTISRGSLSGHCRDTVDTAVARWKLDFEEGDEFSVREIALLADMSEGSVRNAMRAEGDGRLQTVSVGKRVYIGRTEALRWLQGRRGYIPTPEPGFDAARLVSARTTSDIGSVLASARQHKGVSGDTLAAEIGWPVERITAWETGQWVFDLDQAVALAKALDLDPVLLAPRMLEVHLRAQRAGSA
jgi:hypothetical protein